MTSLIAGANSGQVEDVAVVLAVFDLVNSGVEQLTKPRHKSHKKGGTNELGLVSYLRGFVISAKNKPGGG